MSDIHFYADKITERGFTLTALELLTAPFEKANIYCLTYQQNLLGPISQRRVIATSKVLETNAFWKKLIFLVGQLVFPPGRENIIQISAAMMVCSEKTKIYYLYSPYWEQQDFLETYQTMGFFWRKLLDFHKKRVVRSLQKYSSRVICSSKTLASRYELRQERVIYPFYNTQDYPSIDLQSSKEAMTFILIGASVEQKDLLAKWLRDSAFHWNIFLFGLEGDHFSPWLFGVND